MVSSLWGEEFDIDDSALTKKVIEKIKKPKEVKEKTTEQKLKSKTVSDEDKLAIIAEEVPKVLGHHKDNIVTIKDYDSLVKYIDAAIEQGVIAIDTETGDETGHGTLNSFDCFIMGACLYTPGQKYAYVPMHHTTLDGKHLNWQVTEEQLREQLQRLVDANVFQVYHNATFDIEVIMTTCGIRLHADWDTMVASQLIDENEQKGLKTQYKMHIDPEQDKYDIEHLFLSLPYSIIDPDLFALYSATDSFMTYELFKYQRDIFRKPENEDVYWLFKNIEIPVIDAVVDMEMNGVYIDTDYASKISSIYHEKSDAVQKKIDEELENLRPMIDAWRATPEANAKPLNSKGTGYAKSKNEQLMDPPELGSSTQMAILLYDIFKVPVIDKKAPRGTGANILEELGGKIKLCELLLEKRGIDILLDTFIDAIPGYRQKDGRVHARFNQCGAGTGRFSSSNPK